MKKAIAIILCALSVVALFSACTANDSNTPTKSDVSLFDLKEAMLAAAPFGDMAYVSSNDADAETYLSAVSDIAFDKVDAALDAASRANSDRWVAQIVANVTNA